MHKVYTPCTKSKYSAQSATHRAQSLHTVHKVAGLHHEVAHDAVEESSFEVKQLLCDLAQPFLSCTQQQQG